MTVPAWLLRVLAHEAAGLGIAAAVALAGGLLLGPVPWLGGVLLVLALGLALAALRHLLRRRRVARDHPPPGRRVDLGGYRVHLLAEGQARDGRPPVVWFAGGHAGGHSVFHLHRAFRDETRSILIDRPGTGWSDTGPFPRTTAREAEEMVLALERAGERGPFVWAGHSFGGLLVANIARRRPDLVHTLVLLDPTPLEIIAFGPRLSALRGMRRTAWLGGFAQLFGVDLQARSERQARQSPELARVLDAVRAVLGPEGEVARRVNARAGRCFAEASIYAELTPEGVADRAWDTVVYDRDLGDLPVWLVAPQDNSDADIAALPEAQSGDAANTRRMMRFFAAARERYLALSSRSRRVVAPPGSGHNFVYEIPEWTVGVLRDIIDADRHSPEPRQP